MKRWEIKKQHKRIKSRNMKIVEKGSDQTKKGIVRPKSGREGNKGKKSAAEGQGTSNAAERCRGERKRRKNGTGCCSLGGPKTFGHGKERENLWKHKQNGE